MARFAARMTETPTLPRSTTLRYVGVADWWGYHVWVEEGTARRALPYRGDVPLASFSWGRAGIGARELARSIIEHATASPALAERYCRDMTHAIIAQLPALGFELTRDEVAAWLEDAGAPTTR
jgi:hypothetical protein